MVTRIVHRVAAWPKFDIATTRSPMPKRLVVHRLLLAPYVVRAELLGGLAVEVLLLPFRILFWSSAQGRRRTLAGLDGRGPRAPPRQAPGPLVISHFDDAMHLSLGPSRLGTPPYHAATIF